jgi:hypothetical protein
MHCRVRKLRLTTRHALDAFLLLQTTLFVQQVFLLLCPRSNTARTQIVDKHARARSCVVAVTVCLATGRASRSGFLPVCECSYFVYGALSIMHGSMIAGDIRMGIGWFGRAHIVGSARC